MRRRRLPPFARFPRIAWAAWAYRADGRTLVVRLVWEEETEET